MGDLSDFIKEVYDPTVEALYKSLNTKNKEINKLREPSKESNHE